jgi:hypothetical protein
MLADVARSPRARSLAPAENTAGRLSRLLRLDRERQIEHGQGKGKGEGNETHYLSPHFPHDGP